MLDKEAVITAVGAKQYRAVCEQVRTNYEALGPSLGEDSPEGEFVERLAAFIWDADLSDDQRVQLLFQCYDDLPFANLMYRLADAYEELSLTARASFWDEMRANLFQRDHAGRTEPLFFFIVAFEFFANEQRFPDAWAELTGPKANDKVLHGVLSSSELVPFEFKQPVYERLLSDPKWHTTIGQCLLRDTSYWQIDQETLRRIISRLQLPKNSEETRQLRQLLNER